jgi:repressor LexA
MHEIQEKLLRLSQEENLGLLTLREIGAKVGIGSAQIVKHHLEQLRKKGLVRIDKVKGVIEKTQPGWVKGLLEGAKLLSIPIIGTANAGPALAIAEGNIEGYLRISSTLLRPRNAETFFALKVDGPSMNKALVNGKRIEDGDYVIIDSSHKSPKNGDIVLSVIDGLANIKKFFFDRENDQIVLMSESSKQIPPITIHAHDDYRIEGKVVQVIKKPKLPLK